MGSLLQVFTALKSLFVVHHSPGCTASVTSVNGSVPFLKLDVEDYNLVVVFGCASVRVYTSNSAIYVRYCPSCKLQLYCWCEAFTNALVVQPTRENLGTRLVVFGCASVRVWTPDRPSRLLQSKVG